MSVFDRPDFDEMFSNAIYNSREDVVDAVDVDLDSNEWEDDAMGDDDVYFEDDGQPTMYEEYQDLYDGDDWDHGQYDEYWSFVHFLVLLLFVSETRPKSFIDKGLGRAGQAGNV